MSSSTESTSAIMSIARDWSENASSQTSSSPPDASSSSGPPTTHSSGGPPPPSGPGKRPPLTDEQKAAQRLRRLQMLEKTLSEPVIGVKRLASEAMKGDGSTNGKANVKVGEMDLDVKSRPVASGSGASGPSAATTKSGPAISVTAQISLSPEQQEILKLATSGKNIFFTGSAGTGKSVLLREIIRSLRKKYQRSPDAIAITASTGMAACNIGGITLHSFAGIGLGLETAEALAKKASKQKKTMSRWLRTQVLIIDEISMVDGELFDKLARMACLLRKTTKPFGGLQLVVCGDFFQLPPVAKGSKVCKFAFEADLWSTCVERTFNLTKVFRQKEQLFVDMLNEMRFGTLSTKSVDRFKALARPISTTDGIEPTELFPLRDQVEKSNEKRNRGIEGDVHYFTAIDAGTAEPEARSKLLANMMAPGKLALKINTQVMMLKNVDETLVNGSVGKVIGFYEPSVWLQVQNGFTAEEIEEENTKIRNGKDAAAKKRLAAAAGAQVYPVVRFVVAGGSTRDVLVEPDTWKVELPTGEVQASRTQLPLILAWAMSIHKSQGQTLPKVKVDLTAIFEKGQAYVALSRATSLDGLQVLGFDKNKVMAHPKVITWSKSLETIN